VPGRVSFRRAHYLADRLRGTYDAAIMIYCDFGALIPNEQQLLLGKIKRVLADDGVFIFDVFGNGIVESKKECRRWSISPGRDFWSTRPHFLLEEVRHYRDRRAIGTRYVLLDQASGKKKEFILWDQYYDEAELRALLSDHGFAPVAIRNDLIPKKPMTEDDVYFVVAKKNAASHAPGPVPE
jgi:hypothetical protein